MFEPGFERFALSYADLSSYKDAIPNKMANILQCLKLFRDGILKII